MATDHELLVSWRAGDAAAGERLFDRHFRSLNRFFRSKVASGGEDLVQQTLIACVEGRDRIRDDAHFKAYLFGIARRLLYRELERRYAHDKRRDYAVTTLADLGAGLETGHISRQDERYMLEGLRLIPLEMQVAIELFFWEGMTGPQIAEALGVPEGTVRTRIRRGLQRLRVKIEDLQHGPRALESTMTKLDDWATRLRDAE